MVLAGIIGGKVFCSESLPMRLFYLLALTYLVLALLVLATPQIVSRPLILPEVLDLLAYVGLPVLFAVMALLPGAERRQERTKWSTSSTGLFVFLLLAVLVLGSLALMLLVRQRLCRSAG